MSYKFFDIIKGGVYSVLDINGDLKQNRIDNACSKCFAFHDDEGNMTGWCDSKRSGCSCKLEFKGRIEDQKCPNLIWFNNVIDEDKLKEFNKKNNFEL
jgi:hypothetical protein